MDTLWLTYVSFNEWHWMHNIWSYNEFWHIRYSYFTAHADSY